MKHFIWIVAAILSFTVHAQQPAWPVLKHYDKEHVARIAMPIGGIGTGTISLGGNGQWRDVEVQNKPGKGFYGASTSKEAPCFLLFTDDGRGTRKSKALLGPVAISDYAGSEGSTAPNHGLPRFASTTVDAAYPFMTVNLEDNEMPVSVKLRAFNPLIPGDADASGIPVAIIRYEVHNTTSNPLTIAVAGTLNNFIGMDASRYEVSDFNKATYYNGARKNRNEFKKSASLAGLYMTSDSVDNTLDSWGTIALTTRVDDSNTITFRRELSPKGWNANITDMWDDFSDDGMFRDVTFDTRSDSPRGGLSVKTQLAPNETKTIEFLLTWHFPNRKDWFAKGDQILGNYYANTYRDAWDVAEQLTPRLPALEKKTAEFVNNFVNSSYPDAIKEAALFNVSTLRTQTAFRLKDGNFFGWEGIFSQIGSCYGSCTHVWNYEQATPFLFGALATTMRQVEYNYGLEENTGLMSFRVSLPYDVDKNWKLAAADGQMGTVMKVYREWKHSGDDNFLRALYPKVKKALAFAWIPGGWDADKDGVMEGCQHNTMDIEYYGPNPEVGFWYLGALKAASTMAAYMKDKEFQNTCDKLFKSGSAYMDTHLFNGEFYIHQIQPIADAGKIARGLKSDMGSKTTEHPDFQIGEGCLIDQLVGQYMAHLCGLGYLAKPEHVKTALQSIVKYNYVPSFGEHFNNMRSFALGGEPGLSVTAYPDPSKRPEVPLSYFAEAWSGLEYTAAAGMIFEGMHDEALKTITDVRKRYDGLKRSPFNEEECGNHYARAMASWASIVAWSEFDYDAHTGAFSITSRPGDYFWSNGYAWGNVHVAAASGAVTEVTLTVSSGSLKLGSLNLRGTGVLKLKKPQTIAEGNSQKLSVKKQ
ncbi:GH116 family glycosyl-hydrolase [Chryseolinea sp. T2]|uniref:GH116 family glycosyl-hydrolase n=1 Tax=Chryseolinea sp. T2 TaxID=3129255 RepID=UPI0030789BAF